MVDTSLDPVQTASLATQGSLQLNNSLRPSLTSSCSWTTTPQPCQTGGCGRQGIPTLDISIVSVTGHYLASAGFDTSDPRILRLVSLAAQKFVSDVAGEALQHARLRGGAAGPAGGAASRKGSKERNVVMTTEDLSSALGEQGVVVKKPPYFQ